ADPGGRASRAEPPVALTHDPGRVLILGAGPTGLGAAHRFQQLGFDNFRLLEATTSAGGLATSVVDEQGFTWDLGGHVQFSHYSYYDDVLEAALGDEWLWHERESWVWIKGRFVPYPFQNNIHRLDPEDMELALRGLERAAAVRPTTAAAHFGAWIRTTRYDTLITSAPLDLLAESCEGLPADTRRAARALVHSSVHIVGVGLKGPMPAELGRKCWMYYPEDHNPYYRVTVFSNYSPANVPDPESHFSLMAEVCESPYKPVDESSLRDWVLAAMRKDGLIGADADVVSFWHRRVQHGYPTPFLGR